MWTRVWMRKRTNSSTSSSPPSVEDVTESNVALLPVTRDDVKTQEHPSNITNTFLRSRTFQKLLFFALSLVVFAKSLSLLGKDTKMRIKKKVNDAWDFAEAHGLLEPAPAFNLQYQKDYPDLKILEDNYEVIREECEKLLQINQNDLVEVNKLGKYTKGGIHDTKWKSFFFKLGDFIDENSSFAPHTAELLHRIPNIYTAFFSIMEPHQKIPPHWGYWRGYLRYHLGVIIPNDNEDMSSFLRVNTVPAHTPENKAQVAAGDMTMIDAAKTYYWHNGEGVMFDDTYLHDARNDSDEIRVVLWLDVARKLPWYLNIFNKVCLWVAMREPDVVDMRKSAIVKPR